MTSEPRGLHRAMTRRSFVRGAAGVAAPPLAVRGIGRAAAQPSRAKPFAGKTLNVFMFDHPYPRALKELLPQFTELTGIKVEMDTPGFLVYNQRADLELSTGSGAYDVMALTFIFSGKWIGAGWSSRLNDFLARDAAADSADFLSGAMAPMKSGGDVFGLPFVAESTLMVYRRDVFERAGLKPPETFDELLAAAPKIQTAEVKAYMGRGLGGFHWIWPNYLFAYGGRFFADPPRDMTPMLASAESVKSAEVFGRLYREFSVPGVQSYAEPQSSGGMMEGRAARVHRRSRVGRSGRGPGQEQGQGPGGIRAAPGWAGRALSPGRGPRAPDSCGRQAEGRFVGVHQVGHIEGSDGQDCRDGGLSGGDAGERPRQSRVSPEVQLGRRGYRRSARGRSQAGGRRVHCVPDRARVSPHRGSREHCPVGDLHGAEARHPGDARRPA